MVILLLSDSPRVVHHSMVSFHFFSGPAVGQTGAEAGSDSTRPRNWCRAQVPGPGTRASSGEPGTGGRLLQSLEKGGLQAEDRCLANIEKGNFRILHSSYNRRKKGISEMATLGEFQFGPLPHSDLPLLSSPLLLIYTLLL